MKKMGWFVLAAGLCLGISGCIRAVGLATSLPPTPTTPALVSPLATNVTSSVLATITPQAGAATISPEAVPTLAPTAWPLRLAVFFLWPGEVLNLRAEPGTGAEILETIGFDTRALIPTGQTQLADEILWVEIQRPDGSGNAWASADFLTEDVSVEAFCADPRLSELLDAFVLAVRRQDGAALAQLSSPRRGLLIQTNAANPPVAVRDPQTLSNLWLSGTSYDWGVQASSGLPQSGSFAQLIHPALLDVMGAEHDRYCHNLEPGVALGPTASSLGWPDDFINLNYVALHRPAPAGQELNWRTWAVGIEYVERLPYVAALVQYVYEP